MCSFCTRLIDSSPPATMIGTLSTITRCAAIAIACRPDEQKRLTVVPAVVTGSPARSRVVMRRAVGQPLSSVIMVTLGLGALVRGAAALAFGGVPAAIPLPVLASPIVIGGLPIAGDKLVAAAVAATCTAVVAWVFHGSRTGVALRAIADDQQAAMSAGIDLHRYFAITWALMGVVSVLAGTRWTLVAGGGLGIVLVGLKVRSEEHTSEL